MKFEFTRSVENEEPHSFDLGDISISNAGTIISSKTNQIHKVMIYVAISDLVDSITLAIDNKKSVEFSGADSSFSMKISFQKENLKIQQGEASISLPKNEVLLSLLDGIQLFLKDKNSLDENETCYSDLDNSIKLLKSMM